MNDEYEQSGGLLGGKGFYIALMLCVSVIALSAWMIVRETPEKEAEAAVDVTATPYIYQQVIDPVETVQPTPVIEPVAPEIVEVIEPEPEDEAVEIFQAEPVVVTDPKQLSFVWPVVGQIELPYSVDALVYNATMEDWRTHDGLDIVATAGEYVRACAAGTVAEVYEDPLYGTTVVIEHGAGLVSYYANLQAETVVKAGDELLAGDTIGAVGTTAICESTQPAHLHFAMSLDGRSADPNGYLPKLS